MESNLNHTDKSTSRRLASVQEISAINIHSNADKLALAEVLGWQVVIKKDEFKIGDKIVYFEIDSLLPEKDWCEFMKDRNYRVKTIKLRGEISQGLIMPLDILGNEINKNDLQIGQDLTEIVGVEKYENDADLPVNNPMVKVGMKTVKTSTFPVEFIEKTDEPRIQSSPKLINTFTGKPYYATLKYDGTSSTYLVRPDNKELVICSRNLVREWCEDDVYSIIAEKYKIKDKLLSTECRFVIQGEIYGPKISKNYLQVKEILLAVFNIKDIIEDRYLDMEELVETCKMLELPMVEIIEKGESFNYTLSDLKKICKGNYPNTKNPREGLVFRLNQDWHKYGRNSFKIINDDFLIKHNEK